jgi:type IV secretion system protein VirD4
MNKAQVKYLFLLLFFVIAVVGGCYLSGYILLMWLNLPQVSLESGTYFKYLGVMDTPKVAPFAKQIKFSGVVGFAVPFLAWLFGLYAAFKSAPQSVHGDARFATASDLAEKGMFKPSDNGIVVGKMGGKLIRFSGQQFVILAAPTRSVRAWGL